MKRLSGQVASVGSGPGEAGEGTAGQGRNQLLLGAEPVGCGRGHLVWGEEPTDLGEGPTGRRCSGLSEFVHLGQRSLNLGDHSDTGNEGRA